jgi:hypothetical protein
LTATNHLGTQSNLREIVQQIDGKNPHGSAKTLLRTRRWLLRQQVFQESHRSLGPWGVAKAVQCREHKNQIDECFFSAGQTTQRRISVVQALEHRAPGSVIALLGELGHEETKVKRGDFT